jgi:hypothetical protein
MRRGVWPCRCDASTKTDIAYHMKRSLPSPKMRASTPSRGVLLICQQHSGTSDPAHTEGVPTMLKMTLLAAAAFTTLSLQTTVAAAQATPVAVSPASARTSNAAMSAPRSAGSRFLFRGEFALPVPACVQEATARHRMDRDQRSPLIALNRSRTSSRRLNSMSTWRALTVPSRPTTNFAANGRK